MLEPTELTAAVVTGWATTWTLTTLTGTLITATLIGKYRRRWGIPATPERT